MGMLYSLILHISISDHLSQRNSPENIGKAKNYEGISCTTFYNMEKTDCKCSMADSWLKQEKKKKDLTKGQRPVKETEMLDHGQQRTNENS